MAPEAEIKSMYTITTITAARGLQTISTPTRATALRVYRAMRLAGECSRLWFNGQQLIM
jgi:hypothetical protein